MLQYIFNNITQLLSSFCLCYMLKFILEVKLLKNLLKSKIYEAGLNINTTAKMIGVSAQTVTNWCNNRNLEKMIKLKKLLTLLNLELSDIFIE